jgi:hypothetical protein
MVVQPALMSSQATLTTHDRQARDIAEPASKRPTMKRNQWLAAVLPAALCLRDTSARPPFDRQRPPSPASANRRHRPPPVSEKLPPG